MPINSRQKGARAEREVRDLFKAAGYGSARRGQQFAGGADSPDVIVPELPWLHVESKMVEALNIYNAMRQSVRDSNVENIPGKLPTVFHRRNNEQWHVTLRAEDFFSLLHTFNQAIKQPCITNPRPLTSLPPTSHFELEKAPLSGERLRLQTSPMETAPSEAPSLWEQTNAPMAPSATSEGPTAQDSERARGGAGCL